MFFQAPKRVGMLRQGTPVRNFQITASTKSRLPSSLSRPTYPGRPGNRFSTRANWSSHIVKGIKPRDQIEAMLAGQMAAVHMASMTFARGLAHVENIQQQDSAERAFNKLSRTFAAQMSALKEYRSKGEQKMTVQHVHVAEGGQAIVGNVNAPAEGVGANEEAGEQPHALGYAPGVEMPRQIEEEQPPVPRALRSGT